MRDPILDFFAQLAAALFFIGFAGGMIWLIYMQSEANKPKAPTCAEAVRVCVTSQGSECNHVNSYCADKGAHQ